MSSRKRVLILGAAGRDFHNFNMVFRDNPAFDVVAFTATQIPKIDGRKYPVELAGKLYPNGIPILKEDDLESIVRQKNVDVVVFAYSDVSHETVMHLAARAGAVGADFWLQGTRETMLKSTLPVISVCAARTGCGKSQTSRKLARLLTDAGMRVSAIRHPMPYGDLARQAVQRFGALEDLVRHECTVEEREEYEQYIERGLLIWSGVDYEAILREAEKESDVVIWDGGNNDTAFIQADMMITVLDPLRLGHETAFYPGEVNLRNAQVIVVNKVDRASPGDVETVLANVRRANPKAEIILADSAIAVDDESLIRGKRVLVVEDGPTLTHGGMAYGAGFVAAERFGAREIVDPRGVASGSIQEAYQKYPHMAAILPALGYYPEQLKALEASINAVNCDSVIIGTPIDLRRFLTIRKPSTRVTYSLEEREGSTTLATLVKRFLAAHGKV